MREAVQRATAERLAKTAARVRAHGRTAQTHLTVGSAVEGITDAEETVRPDLIVMGTHGRTGLRRVVLGSVTQRTLQRATCPVLSVRG